MMEPQVRTVICLPERRGCWVGHVPVTLRMYEPLTAVGSRTAMVYVGEVTLQVHRPEDADALADVFAKAAHELRGQAMVLTEPCDSCEGSGFGDRPDAGDLTGTPCPTCHGSGLVPVGSIPKANGRDVLRVPDPEAGW